MRGITASNDGVAKLDTLRTPFFLAKDATGIRQPITGGLEVASGAGEGVMVYFGTGAFSFVNDAGDLSQQTLYGVLDNALGSVDSTLERGALTKQEIVSTNDGVRTISRNSMGIGKRGWYLDLSGSGERFVGYPEITNAVVYFPTYQSGTALACGSGGSNWLYGLNAITGGAGLSALKINNGQAEQSDGSGTGAVALTTDGSAPVKDVAVAAIPRLSSTNGECTQVINIPGAETLYMTRVCGRQSWRQLR